MSLPVVTAVTGAPWESALVSSLEREALGITVVRRCIDVTDLLATAATGVARAVLVASDLRRLDREAVARLHAAGVGVVGVYAPGDQTGEKRLQGVGIAARITADTGTAAIAQAVLEAVAALPVAGTPSHAYSRPLAAVPPSPPDSLGAAPVGAPGPPAPLRHGRLVAVWGPAGAPGRTSVAINLAAELAAAGHRVVLADADTYAASIAQALGLLDEAAGLAAAARLANAGSLDLTQLARLACTVLPDLRVLTGLPRADRWFELRPAALDGVWARCRELADVTVVDCGFSLEQHEELAFDVAAPRRNGATLSTLAAADHVVAVGAGDPVGLQRLIRGLDELRAAVPGSALTVVVNRVRASVVGPDPQAQICGALHRHAGIDDVHLVPDDPAGFDAALRDGRTLAERAPSSPARAALITLAHRLVPPAVPAAPARPAAAGRRHRRRAATLRLRAHPGAR